jgi:hypothetical protein
MQVQSRAKRECICFGATKRIESNFGHREWDRFAFEDIRARCGVLRWIPGASTFLLRIVIDPLPSPAGTPEMDAGV